MIILITGSIGSGKSTACRIFEKNGFNYINADTVGHELYENDVVRKIIVSEFGNVLTLGKIDRRKLKDIVFYDKKKLLKLNKIMHPLIMDEIKKRINADTVVEGAVAIEAGWDLFDKLILITIDKEIQIKRLLKKGKYTKTEIENIIDIQKSQFENLKTDYVIDNSGSLLMFEENFKKITLLR